MTAQEIVQCQARLQELYDATTELNAALTFTHCTEDLLRPELDAAIRRVISARSHARRSGLVTHTEAALLGWTGEIPDGE